MKYMIRKPEYIKDAAVARILPNTAITLLIALAILGAYIIVSVIVGVIYSSASIKFLTQEGFDVEAFSRDLLIIALYSEALLIALTLIHTRFIERRPLRTLGLLQHRFALKYVAGFGVGALLLALSTLPAFFAMQPVFKGINAAALVYLGAFIVQSAAEEFVFRGYLLTSLLRSGSALWAVSVSTIVFGLFHIPGNSITFVQLCGVTLLGAVLAFYMLRTGSLWGAMGLHAAWNFLIACLAPLTLGPFKVGYAFFDFKDITADLPLLNAIQFIVLIAAIALLLFAGRGRLVIPRTEEQDMLDNALRIAKNTMRGYGEFRRYALRVAEAAQGKSKIAALLHYAVRCGYPHDMVKYYASPDVAVAVDALTPRPTDEQNDYWDRVMSDPIAAGVKHAENRLAEISQNRQARRAGSGEY